MNQTVIDIEGHLTIRGERLRMRDFNGAWVSAPVRFEWVNEAKETRSICDELYDRIPSRVTTQSTITMTARHNIIPQASQPAWGPQEWEPYRFEYESDRGWLYVEGECAVVSVDAMYGTELRVRPSDYLPGGLMFHRLTPA